MFVNYIILISNVLKRERTIQHCDSTSIKNYYNRITYVSYINKIKLKFKIKIKINNKNEHINQQLK